MSAIRRCAAGAPLPAGKPSARQSVTGKPRVEDHPDEFDKADAGLRRQDRQIRMRRMKARERVRLDEAGFAMGVGPEIDARRVAAV
ncbi:MAG: hypothetical protein A49_24160 [Methyloceanibacter sp.]|nr:MAG: hypothetical protein A49_24160 [Methyloceanibacter sp.]